MNKIKEFLKGTKKGNRVLFILWLFFSIFCDFANESKLIEVMDFAVLFLVPAIISELCKNPVFQESNSSFFKFMRNTKVISRILLHLWIFMGFIGAGNIPENYAFTFPCMAIPFLLPAIIIEKKKNPIWSKNQSAFVMSTNTETMQNSVSKEEKAFPQEERHSLLEKIKDSLKKYSGKRSAVIAVAIGLVAIVSFAGFSIHNIQTTFKENQAKLKAELQTIIDTKVESEEIYTPSSYKNYLSAISEAKAVRDKSNINEKQVQEAKSNLESALAALYVKPDKTELNQKLEAARQINKELYIPNSTTALVQALDEASVIFGDDDAVKDDVQRCITNLEAGIQALIVKPDKTELESLLSVAQSFDTSQYTTVSAGRLSSSISSASETVYNENATQDQVNAAHQTLKSTIDNLVRATQGIYQITCSLKCLATNHVGNSWRSGITYNGQGISSGDKITAPLYGSITITGSATEQDSVPDYGSGSVTIPLSGGEGTVRFYVRENRGRYAGNLATWELTCSATLIERI